MKQEVHAVLWGEVGWFLYETRSACGHGGIDETRSAGGPGGEVGWFIYETRSACGHGGIDETRSTCGPGGEVGGFLYGMKQEVPAAMGE